MPKFKTLAWPAPSEGQSFEGIPELTVPDQSMSLQEIIDRFTRHEQLPIGSDTQYADYGIDLQKLANSDLVDKAEYAEKMAEVQKQFNREEKARQKAAEQKVRDELEAKIRAEKKPTEDNSGGSKVTP